MDLFEDIDDPLLPFTLPDDDGYLVQWDKTLKGFNISIPNGELFYAEHFFDKSISDRSLEYFLKNDSNEWMKMDWRNISGKELDCIKFKNIKWKQDTINFYGKEHLLPRITAWYGDQGKTYIYSGIKSEPHNWNKGLLYIKKSIEEVTDINFNSVLLNWYRDGKDYLSWHADDEKELGINPVIGSVNFGSSRDFMLRANDGSSKITIPLKHGTLLIMKGKTQHYWQHSVPKRLKNNEIRINLTFRFIT